MSRRTSLDILGMKGREKIAMLTAYDFQTARMLDEAGVEILLVGDSLGNAVYGDDNTLSVSMEMMLRHTAAVAKGAQKALIVGDMPFGSYQPSEEIAVTNAARFLSEGHAQAVKLEGGKSMVSTIRRLVDVGIPVMAHVGLTPQSVNQLGGYRMCGKTSAEADQIHADAVAVAQAGAFAIVLECVPEELAMQITQAINVPTIGIGAGNECDGQVLVVNDLLGHTVVHVPKFVQPTANLRAVITEAAQLYVARVKGKSA